MGKYGKKKKERRKDGIRTRQGFGELIYKVIDVYYVRLFRRNVKVQAQYLLKSLNEHQNIVL